MAKPNTKAKAIEEWKKKTKIWLQPEAEPESEAEQLQVQHEQQEEQEEDAADLVSSLTCDLPGGVMMSILCRLPVRKLVQFKCVCKAWSLIIRDPVFIRMHSDYFANVDNDCFLVFGYTDFLNLTEISLLSRETDADKFRKFPIQESTKFKLVGSAKGLLCISPSNYSQFGNLFVLFNPAIQEFKGLTIEETASNQIERKTSSFITLGFGFDMRSNDFKVVRIEQFELKGQYYTHVDVYTLESDSWRRIASPANCEMRENLCRAPLNNRLHWISFVDNVRMISSFDLGDEKFRHFRFPIPPDSGEEGCCHVHTWREEFLSIIYHFDDPGDFRFEIWTMKRYGDDSSWIKEISYTNLPSASVLLESRRNGDFAFLDRSNMEVLLYDEGRGGYRDPDVPGYGSDVQVVNFKETLIAFRGTVMKKVPSHTLASWKRMIMTFYTLLALYIIRCIVDSLFAQFFALFR